MPQIGVIIPMYNGARYLAETVESVLAQTFADWELVIVDDGSTDGSGAVAAAFAARDPRIRLIRQPNGGVARARNAGLHALGSGCGTVIFLDSDDLWYPDSLQILHQALLDDPQAVGAHGAHRLIDATGQPFPPNRTERLYFGSRCSIASWRPIRVPAQQPTTFAVTAFLNPIVSPGTALLRREPLGLAGGFDQTVSPLEDWDMWIRLTARGYLTYVDRTVLAYRRHTGNASTRSTIMAAASEETRRKHTRSTLLTPEQRTLLEDGRSWVAILLHWIWAQEHWERRRYRTMVGEVWRASRDVGRLYARRASRRWAAQRVWVRR